MLLKGRQKLVHSVAKRHLDRRHSFAQQNPAQINVVCQEASRNVQRLVRDSSQIGCKLHAGETRLRRRLAYQRLPSRLPSQLIAGVSLGYQERASHSLTNT